MTHTAGISDTAVVSWTMSGPQSVTVGVLGECVIPFSVTLDMQVAWPIYLPVILRDT